MYKKFYDTLILRYPFLFLLLALSLVGFLGYNSSKMQIDASAETLLLEDDKDLKYFREVFEKYETSNFLIVTFSPKQDLLSKESLDTIKNISNDFLKVENIKSIHSILTVPLLQSPIRPITDLVAGVDSLSTKEFDKNLVKDEFLNSPIYKNALVSADFKTTALILNIKSDDKYSEFIKKRDDLLNKKKESGLSNIEEKELDEIRANFKEYRDDLRVKESQHIEEIRAIIKNYEDDARIFLGGVSMIANDAVSFVKNDLLIYGLSLIAIFIFILYYIFRNPRWVFIPLFICFVSIISTAGILGLFSWEVTVISSNFVALQLIITMSIVIHFIERYRELFFKYKNASQYKLVINTVLSKIIPSIFSILTTVVGFASLVLSKIEPVINLGLMMSVGIVVSLILTFIFLPIFLILLGKKDEYRKTKEENRTKKEKATIISKLPNIVLNKGKTIIFIAIFFALFSIIGASKVFVENSFINYFKSNTEIYKGMKVIDENLGGTTPLDIIINFDSNGAKIEEKTNIENDFFDDFEDEFAVSKNDAQYWFTKDKLDLIEKVHNYLETIPEIGKVQSFATLLKVGRTLNNGKDLDAITLALIYTQLPDDYKKLILSPFVNIEENEARINMRIIDSNDELRRNELIKKINSDLDEIISSKSVDFKLTNLMILYNNMLQSLFDSQIATAGTSLLVLAIMFLILFRRVKMVFVAILTNIIPISLVFGIMGWLAIPLDIMTITIAAIALGIAVDDTIHFMYRFEYELKQTQYDYNKSIKNTLNSVGYPLVYTTLIIVIGFSILMLSNLVPTIYFGLLTAIVMVSVLIANLLLLPKLLLLVKPYKKEF